MTVNKGQCTNEGAKPSANIQKQDALQPHNEPDTDAEKCNSWWRLLAASATRAARHAPAPARRGPAATGRR